MPKIESYNNDVTINDNDKLIGSDGDTGVTKNYTINDLKTYFASTVGYYEHTQTIASTTWVVPHDLDKFPSVSIKFSSSDEVYTNIGALAGVIYTDRNNLTITLAAAESGVAYLN